METEVLVALMGMVGLIVSTLGVVVVKNWRGGVNRISELKEVTDTQRGLLKKKDSCIPLSFGDMVIQYEEALSFIDALTETTNIDRIYSFRSINGLYDPTSATQMHCKTTGESRKFEYKDYPVQPEYVELLRRTYTKSSVKFKTEELDEGHQVKIIYGSEGVIESVWVYLGHKDCGGGRAEIFYMSFSTHDANGITDATQLQCELSAARLREFVAVF